MQTKTCNKCKYERRLNAFKKAIDTLSRDELINGYKCHRSEAIATFIGIWDMVTRIEPSFNEEERTQHEDHPNFSNPRRRNYSDYSGEEGPNKLSRYSQYDNRPRGTESKFFAKTQNVSSITKGNATIITIFLVQLG